MRWLLNELLSYTTSDRNQVRLVIILIVRGGGVPFLFSVPRLDVQFPLFLAFMLICLLSLSGAVTSVSPPSLQMKRLKRESLLL
jgi:hypothetical protein